MYISGALYYFLVAQKRYGLKFQGMSGFSQLLHGVAKTLCPNTAWVLVFLFGIIGFVAMHYTKRRWLALTFILSVGISAVYAIATHKFLYPRTFGYYIPLVAIGCVEAWAALDGFPSLSRVVRPMTAVVMLWALAVSTREALQFGLTREVTYSDVAAEISREAKRTDGPGFIELPWMYGDEMPAYLPSNPAWYALKPESANKPLTVFFPCELRDHKILFRTQTRRRLEKEMDYWTVPAHWKINRYWGSTYAVCEAKVLVHLGFEAVRADVSQAIVVWSQKEPYFNLSSYIQNGLASQQYPWTVQGTGIIPSMLQLFIACPEDMKAARQIIADLQSRTKGEAYVLVPQQ